MAVLETIRVKFGILITVLIAVALLSFIIDPSTLQSVSSSMSSKYDVGEIDGKSSHTWTSRLMWTNSQQSMRS